MSRRSVGTTVKAFGNAVKTLSKLEKFPRYMGLFVQIFPLRLSRWSDCTLACSCDHRFYAFVSHRVGVSDAGKKLARLATSARMEIGGGGDKMLGRVLPVVLRTMLFIIVPLVVGLLAGLVLNARSETQSEEEQAASETPEYDAYAEANDKILGRSIFFGDATVNIVAGTLVAVFAASMLSIGDVNSVVGIGIATRFCLWRPVACCWTIHQAWRETRGYGAQLGRRLPQFGINFVLIAAVAFGSYMIMTCGMGGTKYSNYDSFKTSFQDSIDNVINSIKFITALTTDGSSCAPCPRFDSVRCT